MSPSDPAIDLRTDALLVALDEADASLRALYGKLAADPDLAPQFEGELKDLHARRLELAQRVGLAMLDLRRAPATTVEPEPPFQAVATGPLLVEPAPAPVAKAPDVPEPDEPRSDRASETEIAQWANGVRSSGLGAGLRTEPSKSTAWSLVLHELMDALGPPRDVTSTIGAIEEIEALDDIATPGRQELWVRLPRHVQQLWLSMLVARTRVVREMPSSTPETKARVKVIIGRYPPWANAHTPGHVNGLQVKHVPLHGSWAQDARHGWTALGDLLGEELVVRPATTPRKKQRRTEPEDDDGPEIDPGWHVLPLVRGQKAIVVGGDPREPSRLRLERALQLGSLEWPAIDGPRKVESVVGRIDRRTYGLVLVLRPFVAHNESEPIIEAAKRAGTPWAMVEGYGLASVKLGLERFLGGPRSGASLPEAGDGVANG